MAPFPIRLVDDIAIVVIGNDQNRFTIEYIEQWNETLDAVLRLDDVKALITTAVGKFYSNGVDISRFAGASLDEVEHFWRQFNYIVARIATFPIPTVAAINGHSFAGGAFIAIAHDYRVMHRSKGWFSYNEVFLGVRIPEFLLHFLRLKLPQGVLQTRAVVYGHRFTGPEALEAGIAQDIGDNEEDIVNRAVALAKQAVGNNVYSREMFQAMKEDLYHEALIKKHGGMKLTSAATKAMAKI